MVVSERKLNFRGLLCSSAVVGLLLALFFVHLYVRVNPALLYHNEQSPFLMDAEFFSGFAARPGGLVAYASLFCWQFCYWPWAGALVITAITGLICLATYGLLCSAARARVNPAACFLPAVLLLTVYGRYSHDLTASMQILVALGFANLYAFLALRKWYLRLSLFVVLSPLVYYLDGGGYAFYAALCGLLEILRLPRSRRAVVTVLAVVPGLLYLACGTAVPYGYAEYSYELDPIDAYAPLLPFNQRANPSIWPLVKVVQERDVAAPLELTVQGWLHLALVALFPLALVWAGARRKRARLSGAIRRKLARAWAAIRRREASRDVSAPNPGRRVAGWTLPSFGALVIVGTVAAAASLDHDGRALLATHYAARNRMWDQVLVEAEKIPIERYSVYVMNDVNMALFHKGRLAYEMFAHPQRLGRDSVLVSVSLPMNRPPTYERLSEVFYELGFVNEAEHQAHEALEKRGQNPAVLKLLAKVNILKGLPRAARTFIGALGKHFLYHKWAEDYLRKLDADPLLVNDEEMNNDRVHMIRADYVGGVAGDNEPMSRLLVRSLEQQLQIDRYNKKAFEYLMAHYLLTKQLDKVIANIHRLDDFDYPDVPRHYEEAILLYIAFNRGAKVPLGPRRLSPASVDSFKRWARVLAQYKEDWRAAGRAMMQSHDRTYLLYYTLGISDSRMFALPSGPGAVTGATQ